MPSATSSSSLRGPSGRVRRAVRRHRRPLAATLAGLAAIVGLTALRSAPQAPPAAADDPASSSSTAEPGQVTVPVTLASGAIAAVLRVGDVIDLVGSSGSGTSGSGTATDDTSMPMTVIARDARVVELPAGGSALGGSSSAVILVSLPEADALRVVTSMRDGLTPVIRSR